MARTLDENQLRRMHARSIELGGPIRRPLSDQERRAALARREIERRRWEKEDRQ